MCERDKKRKAETERWNRDKGKDEIIGKKNKRSPSGLSRLRMSTTHRCLCREEPHGKVCMFIRFEAAVVAQGLKIGVKRLVIAVHRFEQLKRVR